MGVGLSVAGLLVFSFITSIVYIVTTLFYRAFLSPLAKIPGPFWARVTYFYLAKYNLWSDGSHFYLQIEKLHQQYGPVIRISPTEVHLSDPENYNPIHKVGTKFTKDPSFYDCLAAPMSVLTTQSNELHRVRRAALAPLFTRARILELEDVVQTKVEKLCSLLKSSLAASTPFDLYHGVRDISIDTITDYAFNDCWNLLDKPDMGRAFFASRKASMPRVWLNQAFPFLTRLTKLPRWVAEIISPPIAKFMAKKEAISAQVLECRRQLDAGVKIPRRTIFHQLLDPNAAEGHIVPSVSHVSDDAFIIVAAASETVGMALTQAFWRVLSDQHVLSKLTTELNSAFPDPTASLSFTELEKLPYLTACLKESLRLACALPGRLARVVPNGGATFNGYFLPEGTSVSMSQWMMHRSAAFPEPMSFKPERWLDETTSNAEKYLVPFGRGSRACLGMTLAWCELYLTLGTIIRRCGKEIEIAGYGEEDFYPIDDYLAGWARDDARLLTVVNKKKC